MPEAIHQFMAQVVIEAEDRANATRHVEHALSVGHRDEHVSQMEAIRQLLAAGKTDEDEMC